MMRIALALVAALAVAGAAHAQAISVPVRMDVPPLAPLDLLTPYASPRDAARHRLQATLAQLQENKDLRAGVRGLAQALATDPSYAIGAYNLGVLCVITEQWNDALAAFQEAATLDPALAASVGPEIERLTLITTLERVPGGAAKWRYERALFDALSNSTSSSEARMQRLVEIAKLDPSRWETPALMAVAMGDARQYDSAARFLQVAATNAADSTTRTALDGARKVAEREQTYAKAFGDATQLATQGQWKQAADNFEAAWHVFPARAASGMQAAVARLMVDDTMAASQLLWRIRAAGDPEAATKATAMLKALEPVEPVARQPPVSAAASSASDTVREPAGFAALIPETRTPQMAILGRPSLKFTTDPAPIRLYESLSLDPMVAVRAASAPLPSLPPPVVTGDAPMVEVRALSAATVGGGPTESVSRTTAGRVAREAAINSVPRRAAVYIDAESTPVCRTPCIIQTSAASMALRLQSDGYEDKKATVQFGGKPSASVTVTLSAQPGFVVVDAPGSTVAVNGIAVPGFAPLELALQPGVHRVEVLSGDRSMVMELTVKPGVRIRFPLTP